MPQEMPLPLPLIRHFSRPLTPVLARLPVSANHVTAMSLVAGLTAAWAASLGNQPCAIVAGALLVVCYVLDNCDGEVARLKDQCSAFGAYFDSFVDWVVHTAFFIALGFGMEAATDEDVWIWLGWAAGMGGTVNYFLGLWIEAWEKSGAPQNAQTTEASPTPRTIPEWIVFAFRELTRADFCFIVLLLALLDAVWVLLPMGAIGAQVYWIMQISRRARQFHV